MKGRVFALCSELVVGERRNTRRCMKEKAEIYSSSFFFKFSKRCMYACVVPSEVLIHIHAWQRSEVLCRRLSENSLRMLWRERTDCRLSSLTF